MTSANRDSIEQARADIETATRQFIKSLLDHQCIEDVYNPDEIAKLVTFGGAQTRLHELIPADFQGSGMSLAEAESQLGKALLRRDSFRSEMTDAETKEAARRLALIGTLPELPMDQYRWDKLAAHSYLAARLIDSPNGVERPTWLTDSLRRFQAFQGLNDNKNTTPETQFLIDPLMELVSHDEQRLPRPGKTMAVLVSQHLLDIGIGF